MTAGIQTHIWNNNLKSIAMLALYPLIIMALVWGCSYIVGTQFAGMSVSNTPQGMTVNIHDPNTTFLNPMNAFQNPSGPVQFAHNAVISYWPIILSVVVIWFIISYFFHSKMIRKLSHAKPVSRTEEPELYNLLENLCISQGMPMPRLNIIETHARNAFASGIDQKSFAVTVTRGLMHSLAKDELEGVLAHELTHIQNRDVRLLMVTVIFTGMIGLIAQLVWSNVRYGMIFGGENRKRGSSIFIMVAIAAVLWIGYMATLFMRFAVSRRREYMADAGAVMMTKNPDAMMRALMRISGKDQIPETSADVMMMCFENHVQFMGLFATHPPIEKRIGYLSEMTGASVPSPASLPPIAAPQRFGDKPNQNPWITRARRSE